MQFQKDQTPWNKGIKKSSTGKAATVEKELERKRKISETMKLNPNSGGLREGSGRGKKCWHESPIAGRVYMRSTYELEYAKWLDNNKINWLGNKKFFEYIWEGVKRKYYPDFYLIDENCFIEVKGFKTKQDEVKWEYFEGNLKVLYGKDLINMGIIVKL